jgi:flagellar motility protein MotE (MotC chaperone)
MISFLIGFLREVRLVPIVLIATVALFALKVLGLVLDNGYLFDEGTPRSREEVEITGSVAAPKNPDAAAAQAGAVARQALNQPPKRSWAQEMFNFPDVTGAVGPGPPGEEAAAAKTDAPAKKPIEPPPSPKGTPVPLDNDRPVSPAERALLESLQKRRAELDARNHELDIREDLLRAAEKRLEGRLAELKELEARVNEPLQQKNDEDTARFKNLVTMYENMKAKDAAKIFDGLDIKVLLDVAKQINPRRMSDILAQMSPDTAQRLTTELAVRSANRDQPLAAELPKIQGKPSSN